MEGSSILLVRLSLKVSNDIDDSMKQEKNQSQRQDLNKQWKTIPEHISHSRTLTTESKYSYTPNKHKIVVLNSTASSPIELVL